MTLIADALSRAARQCSVNPPSSWASATDATSVQIKDYLEDTVYDVLDRVDPPAPLAAAYTLTSGSSNADGSTNYTMPSAFRRLQRDEYAVFETTNQRQPLLPITNDGEWQHLIEVGSSGSQRYYRLKGFEGNWTMDVFSAPGASDTIYANYISENWMEDSGGTDGSSFTANEDVLLLPRRLVEAGIVWRFRERRGLPYTDKYNEYEAMIARFSNDRRTRRKINFGGQSEIRKPWNVQVPDFIPSS